MVTIERRRAMRPHKKDVVPGSFGAAIRALREERNMSQVELGERTGLGQNNISRIETGDVQRPQQTTVIALAAGLGVTPNEIWLRTSFPKLSWQIEELQDAIMPLGVDEQLVMTHLARFLREHQETFADRDPEEIAEFFRQALASLDRNGARHDNRTPS